MTESLMKKFEELRTVDIPENSEHLMDLRRIGKTKNASHSEEKKKVIWTYYEEQ